LGSALHSSFILIFFLNFHKPLSGVLLVIGDASVCAITSPIIAYQLQQCEVAELLIELSINRAMFNSVDVFDKSFLSDDNLCYRSRDRVIAYRPWQVGHGTA